MKVPLDAKSANPREGGPSFSLSHRMFRLVWGICWSLLGRTSPLPFHGWRRFLLRSFGAVIDPAAKVYPEVRIWYPPNLVMEAFSCLAPGANCYNMDKIHLKKYALVSQGAHLCAGSHDIDDPHFQLVTRPIEIGENAWVAAEAFVGPGVRIGDHAVLGARAVTFKDLQPGMVYAGNPAKMLRPRHIKGSIA